VKVVDLNIASNYSGIIVFQTGKGRSRGGEDPNQKFPVNSFTFQPSFNVRET